MTAEPNSFYSASEMFRSTEETQTESVGWRPEHCESGESLSWTMWNTVTPVRSLWSCKTNIKKKRKLGKLKRKHAWQTPVWSRGNFRWESVTGGEKICSSSGKSGVVTLASLIIADSWAVNVTFGLKFGLKEVCTSKTVDLTQMQIEKKKTSLPRSSHIHLSKWAISPFF